MSGSHHEKLLWFPGYSAAGHDINKQMCSGIMCGRAADRQASVLRERASEYGKDSERIIQKE